MSIKTKVVYLPPVSIKNPYQSLMVKGLRENKNLIVIKGYSSRYIGILLSSIIYRPQYIHFDWINKYYLKKYSITTIISSLWFLIQIVIITKLLRTEVVWTMHNLSPHDSKQLKINEIVQKLFIKNCKWIRVFSTLTISRIANKFNISKNKIISVPEGSYVDYYPNEITRIEARKKMRIGREKMFLYIGTIKPYKGIIDLIKIFSKINDDNIKLIIAGKVTNRTYLKKITQLIDNNNSIKLVNQFIDPNALQIFFNAADAVILPFKNIENSGSAILAMGFKKIIITPNLGVLPDRLKNQKEFLYTNDLMEKIYKVLSMNYKDIEKIGQKNFIELKNYNWSDYSKYFIN